MSRYSGIMLNELSQIFNRGTFIGLNDHRLLERFVAERDETAFAALVARHGPMVLGVCRRILREEHDVEDAFQATFLVLVRRAKAIRDAGLLGHWIHGVAYRVAVRARANAARRYVHEQNEAEIARLAIGPPCRESQERELRKVLDEELARLPEPLRAPLVLCYLEGMTHAAAADQLRWPVGTVRSRLARARDLLRSRLSRRGLTTDDAVLTTVVAAQPVPFVLLDHTVRISLAFMARHATTTTVITSTTAKVLANGVLKTMMMSKLKVFAAATLAGFATFGGMHSYALQFGGSGGPAAESAPATQPKADDPQGALARSVAGIQAKLTESARLNAELQKQLKDLQAELEAERQRTASLVGKPAGSPPKGAAPAAKSTAKRFGAGLERSGGGGMGGGGGAGGMANMGRMGVMGRGVVGGIGGGTPPMGGLSGMMGGGGGMGLGSANSKDHLSYIQANHIIVAASPGGDTVTSYNTNIGKSKSLRLKKANSPKVQVTPIVSNNLVALALKGPEVTRIAAFSIADGNWYSQELREPAQEVNPVVGAFSAAYTVGRRVYAFSSTSNRWDVLEMPEGADPSPIVSNEAITCEHEAHLYIFNPRTGRWEDIDTRSAADAPDDAKK